MSAEDGFSAQTLTVHAGGAPPDDGEPFLAGPVLAAAFRLRGEVPSEPAGYTRYANPTFSAYEDAVGTLEGGTATVFSSGMAAVAAVLHTLVGPGDVLVVPSDAYPGVRAIALDQLEPLGVEVRLVPTEESAIRDALSGAAVVWVETPSNPGLAVLDVPALAASVHGAGARLVVDATLAGPLRRPPLRAGADVSVLSASKQLTGHTDLVMGVASARDGAVVDALRSWRATVGSVPGPFEVWLAHRSLATLGVRGDRQEENARALVAALRGRPGVEDVRWPGVGCVVAFTLQDAACAQRFLAACRLVGEATSFGGVHSTAERRGRWGTDDVAPGWIRLSAGIEAAEDLVADVLGALERAIGSAG